MAAVKKPSVLNPLTLRNRVGEELADIFEANDIDNFEELIGVKNLRSKEKLSAKTMRKAAGILSNPNLPAYLVGFQEEYLAQKPRYVESYKEARKAYNKLKVVSPLLRCKIKNGYDTLDDILDFFGADTIEEVLNNPDNAKFLEKSH